MECKNLTSVLCYLFVSLTLGTRFLWAAGIIEEMGHCKSPHEVREAYKYLPSSLSSAYDRALGNVKGTEREELSRVLQWLACSARLLTMEEIVEACAVDISNPSTDVKLKDRMWTICSDSIVRSQETEENSSSSRLRWSVKLVYQSLKTFLISEQAGSTSSSLYKIDEIQSNISIAKVCLVCLHQFERPESFTTQSIEKHPLAKYAARYWTQHAQAAGSKGSVLHELIIHLLSTEHTYRNWIRLWDPDQSSPLEEPWEGRAPKHVCDPLYYMSLIGLVDIVQKLLDRGADVNVRGGYYDTPLNAASFKGHLEVVRVLLKHGADPNARRTGERGEGDNALQAASLEGHAEVVRLLLRNGADVNAESVKFGRPLQTAVGGGQEDIVGLLREHGANVNAVGADSGTALQAAIWRGHGKVAQMLRDAGATET